MSSRSMMIFVAISGFIFVALGAFGAHVLNRTLGEKEMEWLYTGLNYQGVHTLAILGMASVMQRRACIWFYWSSALMALGTVLFSGSLYSLALSNLKLWVYVTPIGGVCFLIGWALMLVGALRMRKRAERHE